MPPTPHPLLAPTILKLQQGNGFIDAIPKEKTENGLVCLERPRGEELGLAEQGSFLCKIMGQNSLI